jgi:hypothetical protein
MDLTSHFKKGYKTTEFWFALAAALIALFNSAFGWDLDAESLLALAGTVVAYIASRSYLKANRVKALAEAEPFEVPETEAPPVG